ncbi:HET-domain-containing protein, partial [Karstenula rhodostoma CBS 690.94]
GQYATLSHCWGARQPLATTKATITARERGIADTQLPQTFRDAVHVCRVIGIRYLWIDSLCIIQDCDEDWASEAAAMSDIYHYSVLTIAAAGARDSTEGCFQPRNGLTLWPWFGTVFGRPSRVTRYSYNRRGTDGNLEDRENNCLNSSVWVLQEEVLSRRTLAFGCEEMTWKCQGMFASETLALGVPHAKITYDHRLRLQGSISTSQLGTEQPSKAHIFACWYQMIADYPARNLTFKKDKLAAIASLASRFATASKTKYCAGLWEEDIIKGLLWASDSGSTGVFPDQRLVEPLAPTWSWACGLSRAILGTSSESRSAVHCDASH